MDDRSRRTPSGSDTLLGLDGRMGIAYDSHIVKLSGSGDGTMSTSRRFIAGLARIALVVVAIAYLASRFSHHTRDKHTTTVTTEAVPPAQLAAGDMRIYNTDSSVDLTLVGNSIYAGLSPKTVNQVKTEMNDKMSDDDTNGLAGSIKSIVKSSVAGAIGTHAVFPLSNIRDIRYDHEQIVVDWKDGGHHELFGSTRVNGEKGSRTFRPEDAQRFVDAVRARLKSPVGS